MLGKSANSSWTSSLVTLKSRLEMYLQPHFGTQGKKGAASCVTAVSLGELRQCARLLLAAAQLPPEAGGESVAGGEESAALPSTLTGGGAEERQGLGRGRGGAAGAGGGGGDVPAWRLACG
mmetsp:Transcript_19098/g.53229  ORF Transcript_19098/g.53229 Transcript_19098/m.53229 type:complete len:121 (+) Transcript_19098:552-914(+)